MLIDRARFNNDSNNVSKDKINNSYSRDRNSVGKIVDTSYTKSEKSLVNLTTQDVNQRNNSRNQFKNNVPVRNHIPNVSTSILNLRQKT